MLPSNWLIGISGESIYDRESRNKKAERISSTLETYVALYKSEQLRTHNS